jgi:hypothetical protein
MGLNSQQKNAVEQLVQAAKTRACRRKYWTWFRILRPEQFHARFDAERKILDELGGLRIKDKKYSDYDLLFRPLLEPTLGSFILGNAERLLKQKIAAVASDEHEQYVLSVDERGRVYITDGVSGPDFGFIAENITEAMYLWFFDHWTLGDRCSDCGRLSEAYGLPHSDITFVIPDEETRNLQFYSGSSVSEAPLLTRPILPIPPVPPNAYSCP